MRIAVIGLGTMGRALAGALLSDGSVAATDLVATVGHAENAERLGRELGLAVGTDNCAAVAKADLVLLCVKPGVLRRVLGELREAGALEHGPLVVSIAAGVRSGELEQLSGGALPVVRAMPNTPCLVGEGMSALCAGGLASSAHLDAAEALLAPLGRVVRLDEEHMDAVTGLSASGPAFVYLIIEALSEGGVMVGLPRKVAVELAAQTVLGAARMVQETGRHPAALKDDVTTPAGCTISALLALEDGKLRSVLARGVQEAARAASEL
ncbi:MAG: pyrroline-5-carboxylate reductase [Planctomycetes bacterium]|jgi:pyrroline-5-carboxylate reductase|nr:pyrroline-5-carboxylate reductase [Planctomycetota bacterium]